MPRDSTAEKPDSVIRGRRSSPASLSGIRDNRERGSVADFLRVHLAAGADLDLVTAYFTVFAYHRLRDHLDALNRVRLLFGEAKFIRTLDPEKDGGASFTISERGLTLASGLQQRAVAKACSQWIERLVEIRSVCRGFLHGKMSHITPPTGTSAAIVGSSNFTVAGLGLSPGGGNLELNLTVPDDRDRDDLAAWFEEVWQSTDVEDVKAKVLAYLAQAHRDQSPEFVYFKTLFHLFFDLLQATRDVDRDLQATRLVDTRVWRTLYEFQRDGAKGVIRRLLEHNGCILADSVGLGKTYTGLAVIKFFELRNERVLVLCPKKLRENWLLYRHNSKLNPLLDDGFRYDVLHHTDMSRDGGESNGIDLAKLYWGNYDLLVIDESHNFRNNASAPRGPEGERVRRTRYERLMEEVIQAGVRTKVLLLSATPVNNDLSDLRNQVSFIAGGDVTRNERADSAFLEKLSVRSVKATTREAQSRFTAWAKLPPDKRHKRALMDVLGGDFLRLLDGLSIARSRKHVQRHYGEEMERLGGFPTRRPPETLHPEIDTRGEFPTYDVIAERLGQVQLWVFRPSEMLRDDLAPDVRDAYVRQVGPFDQKGRERILTAMMRVTLLKRLESSIDSFRLSLGRTLKKITDIEERMARFERARTAHPDFDFETVTADAFEDDEDMAEALEVGRRIVFKMAHLDLERWRRHLAEDRTHLQGLLDAASPVDPARDGKLALLRQRIAAKVRKPPIDKDGRANRKVLLFTAFADTARYLYDQLAPWARQELGIHCALVVGSGANDSTLGRQRDYNALLADFAPRAKKRGGDPDQAEVDLLVASDCISEGQNLQDADTVINYDIHWNPVRIIQRFGRIDRIGSRAQQVHLVNFWPTANLDRYINLKVRVESRMALADLAATQTDNPLDHEQLEDLVTTDLRFRDRQLVRMREEVLDLEDLDETVSLADFSLDDFRVDLLKYLESNRKELEEAPPGIFAVVPPDPRFPAASPGVLFCLRHKGEEKPSPSESTDSVSTDAPLAQRTVNPISPHYLVLVRDDGEIRLGFAQARVALQLLRELCLGKAEPYEELCRLFDRTTDEGADMSRVSKLLSSAVRSVTDGYRRRALRQLAADRSFVLPPEVEQPREEAGFELVTWLVILAPQVGDAHG